MPRKITIAKYEQRIGGDNRKRITTAAISEDLDTGVGKLLANIDRLGLAGNTYIIYMSDNGASGGGRKVLNGGKGGMWEGGIRVPLIIRGPGVKANSWCHSRVVGYDFFPTICEWAGISAKSLRAGIEGGSFVQLLASEGQGEVKRPREELVFHFPHYQGDSPHSAIMLGKWKLLHFYEDGRDLLFDLASDIGERNDLASQQPDEVCRLRERLETYLNDVKAQLPTPNPNYQANQPMRTKREMKGKKEEREASP